MSNTPTRNFSLTAELDGFIRERVASGRYSNAGEAVRAGGRLLMQRGELPRATAPSEGTPAEVHADGR